ncbi:hypothetical protein R1flu_011942 [Riccia fluitans]|uniref:Uncharacterized protein n=1 Tax=Riccia fluitans TaxID=41844 RepID=A0ABD1Z974_9MARC
MTAVLIEYYDYSKKKLYEFHRALLPSHSRRREFSFFGKYQKHLPNESAPATTTPPPLWMQFHLFQPGNVTFQALQIQLSVDSGHKLLISNTNARQQTSTILPTFTEEANAPEASYHSYAGTAQSTSTSTQAPKQMMKLDHTLLTVIPSACSDEYHVTQRDSSVFMESSKAKVEVSLCCCIPHSAFPTCYKARSFATSLPSNSISSFKTFVR